MKKILFITNTPFNHSSYAQVTKNMIMNLPNYEWYVLSRQWKNPPMIFKAGEKPYYLLPSNVGDNYCYDSMERTINEIKPDYLITIGDIEIQYAYALKIKNKKIKIKWYAYMPIDTSWLNKELITQLKHIQEIGTIVSMSKFGQERITKLTNKKPKLVYHGVNLEIFKPLKLTERTKLRKKMGLIGKFIVFINSNNQERKQLPALIEAFKKANIPNKFLILHTDLIPSQYGGIELSSYIKHLKIENITGLTQNKQYNGWRNEFPDQRINTLYNISDCFILNGNEGFGLPVLESQATNTPVIAGNITTMKELIPKENLCKIHHYHYMDRVRYAIVDTDEMSKKLETISKTKIKNIKLTDVKIWTWKRVCEKWKKLLK